MSPASERIIWLFSMVLGHSRMLWGRFVLPDRKQAAARHLTKKAGSIDDQANTPAGKRKSPLKGESMTVEAQQF